MSKRIKLGIAVGLIILLLVAVFATAAFAQGPGGAFGGMMGGGQGYGPGMMGRQGFGGMIGSGQGMMGGQGFGGMMGPGNAINGAMPADCPMFAGAINSTNGQPIGFDRALEVVQQYIESYINPDLTVAEVMEFENNFYAVVTEKSTGKGAFELLVNRYTGVARPEPGPNMMWNTRYGHMAGFGGMMNGMTLAPALRSGASAGVGGRWNQQTGPMTVTAQQARTTAQQWLDANQPGATLADDEVQFYGYYSMDFLRDGKVVGMLSVNGYTGQVWYHTWHGEFISEEEF